MSSSIRALSNAGAFEMAVAVDVVFEPAAGVSLEAPEQADTTSRKRSTRALGI
jgi:hypothetical protein